MIPQIDSKGNLPYGMYFATMEELIETYGYNLHRRIMLEKLNEFIEEIKKTGCKALYIDGSFVTGKLLPGDIDLCWDNSGMNYQEALNKMPLLDDMDTMKLQYGLHVFPAFIFESDSKKLFIDFFQTDKVTGLPKGIIKILI